MSTAARHLTALLAAAMAVVGMAEALAAERAEGMVAATEAED